MQSSTVMSFGCSSVKLAYLPDITPETILCAWPPVRKIVTKYCVIGQNFISLFIQKSCFSGLLSFLLCCRPGG